MTWRAAWGVALVAGCTVPPPTPPPGPALGGPLDGLDAGALGRFERGRTEFLEVEEVGEGLGPLFNARSCAECHSAPAVGGLGASAIVRAGRAAPDGSFVEPPGGSLVHAFSTHPDVLRADVPRDATVIARRLTPPVFGLGLVEAIADDAIVAQAARTDRPAGIAGRVAWVTTSAGATRVGRFGSKAQRATLFDFSGDAYRDEMGITNEVAPEERAPGGDDALLDAVDLLADPEAATGTVGRLADFMRFLGAVPPAAPGDVAAGRAIFDAIGCGGCHLPSYRTAADAPDGLADREVALYSDLLLHDIGTGDGIAQGAATPREQRTTPLWGLRFRRQLLHDGRALGVRAAILAHDGEAASVRAAHDALSPADQDTLAAFLDQL